MCEKQQPHVELGFLEKTDPWQLESCQFPSKAGGKPAWLSPKHVPKFEDLQCKKCEKAMIFLCQVYSPFEDEHNFHRTIFIFICKNPACCERNNSDNVKVFRSNLPRKNEFYSYEDPDELVQDRSFSLSKWVNLCQFCGCLAEKKCSKCRKVSYCCREHQVIDWKEAHKSECGSGEIQERLSSRLFPEFEIVIEEEEEGSEKIDELKELSTFKELELEGKTGSLQGASSDELEAHAAGDEDKTFTNFREIVKEYPDQVLRYEKGGDPLWVAEGPRPESIPNCDHCGSPRQFEFQIMPQILFYLKDNVLDFGTIIVYTCIKSCSDSDNEFKREFVFKQDVSSKEA